MESSHQGDEEKEKMIGDDIDALRVDTMHDDDVE
jgi:hypothetical protein